LNGSQIIKAQGMPNPVTFPEAQTTCFKCLHLCNGRLRFNPPSSYHKMSFHDISSSTKMYETCQILKQDCGEKMERDVRSRAESAE